MLLNVQYDTTVGLKDFAQTPLVADVSFCFMLNTAVLHAHHDITSGFEGSCAGFSSRLLQACFLSQATGLYA